MISARCPACGSTVWFSDLSCPACKAMVSLGYLQDMKKRSGGAGAGASGAETQARGAGTQAGGESYAGSGSSAGYGSSAASGATGGPVTRRMSWWQVFFGVVVVLGAVGLYSQVGVDNSSSRSSRRVQALENLIGESGTELLLGTVLLAMGGYLIATSNKKYKAAAAAPAGSSYSGASSRGARACGCQFCGQTTPDAAPAFLTVTGGLKNVFAGAFRCSACEGCVKKVGRLRRFLYLQLALILPGAVIVPIVLVFGLIFLIDPKMAVKPAARDMLLTFVGIAAALSLATWAMHRYVKRRTGELLGTDLDGRVRGLIGIKRWGWPRHIGLSREVETDKPIMELQ